MSASPFLTEISEFMQTRRYSKRTISTYLVWIKRYINFSGKRHPKDLDGFDIERFLTHLAVNRHVAPSTQSLALNALVFLYNTFLNQPLGDLAEFKRAKKQTKLPTVLTQHEVSALLKQMEPKYKLLTGLLYGSGLRRLEVVRLRVNDIDFDYKQIRVWNGKGFKHRLTTLAPELLPALQRQIEKVTHYLAEDNENSDFSGVWMPDALARKYQGANKQLGWQYLFPSHKLSTDPSRARRADIILMKAVSIRPLNKRRKKLV